jgi:hypothetical protein
MRSARARPSRTATSLERNTPPFTRRPKIGSGEWFITQAGFLLEDRHLGLTLGTSAGLAPISAGE